MRIERKGKTKSGVNIQIEDWSKDYSFLAYGVLGAYPIAKKQQGFIKKDTTFRVEFANFKNNEEIYELFEKLERGELDIFVDDNNKAIIK